MPATARTRKRIGNVCARWRGGPDGAVVLTTTGELWRRLPAGRGWALKTGRFTVRQVEAWAATQGYLRAVGPNWEAFRTDISPQGRAGLSRLAKDAGADENPRGDYGPMAGKLSGDVLADRLARIERYAARAKAKQPLFGG